MKLNDAIEAVYTSLDNNNEDIDLHIANLKAAMKEEGVKQATFKPERLAQNNRQGRKMMEAYFKKRGVPVVFEK
jgi:ribosomal protein S1